MSTTIDEKVVEMRFDNSHFERNVSQSMSTLDKLKAKLNFKDSSKGLKEIQEASSKMDFSTLNGSIESVRRGFSAMEVVGITALANITNSAINTGKRLVSSLSIDQVMAGWSKGEQKISSIQTLVNSTGKSLDEIDNYLDQLMWYSDETSYSFTEMVSSLASMTSSGGDIDKLIPTIMGIANATAFAGKGANEFSRVIYNLQQSYGQGYLSAIDWKSVQLAGVNSKALIEVLIDEGRKAGTVTDDLDVSVSNFASTLQKKWVTSEVMENAFGRLAEFSMAVKDMVDSGKVKTAAEAIDILRDSYDELTVKMFTSAQEAKSFREAIDATKDAVSSGWMTTFEKIFGNYEETKTFWTEVTNSLWDIFASGAEARNEALDDIMTNNGALKTLKKTLESTGHSMGDFEEALLTVGSRKQQDELRDLIDTYGSLEAVLNKVGYPVKFLKQAFDKLTGSEGEIAIAANNAIGSLEDMQALVNSVIRGDWGNGQERVDRMTEAGHSYIAVQTLVNKVWERNGRTWRDTTITAEDLAEAIALMTDEERKNIGLTDDQIDSIDDLIDKMTDGKLTAEEMWEALSKPTGRALLTGSITNILEAITNFITVVKTAWKEVFGGIDTGEVYNIIKAINDFTKALILDGITETEDGEISLTGKAKALADALKIVFGVLKIVTSILGGAFKVAWNVVKKVFEAVKNVFKAFIKILPQGVSKLKDWFTNGENIASIFEKISTAISKVIDFVTNLIKSFFELEPVKNLINTIYDLFVKVKDAFSKWFSGFKDAVDENGNIDIKKVASNIAEGIKSIISVIVENASDIGTAIWEVGKEIVLGLIQGIKDNAGTIWEFITGIFSGIIDLIKGIFGIHSPSLIMIGIGGMLIAGLVAGISTNWDTIWEKIKELGAKFIENIGVVMAWIKDFIIQSSQAIKESISGLGDWIGTNLPGVANFFGDLTFGKAVGAGLGIGGLIEIGKLGDSIHNFSELAESLGDVLWQFSKIEKAVKKYIKFKAFQNLAKGALLIAVAIGIVVGSIWLLTKLDVDKAWKAIGLLSAIVGLITGAIASLIGISRMAGNASKLGIDGKKFSLDRTGGGLFGSLLGIAIAVVAFAIALRIVSKIPEDKVWEYMGILAAIVAGVVGLILAITAMTKSFPAESKAIKQLGGTLLKIAIAMLLMVLVFKLVNKLSLSEILKGIGAMILVGAFMFALMLIGNIANENHFDPSNGLIKIMLALLIMVIVFKLAGTLKPQDILGGITCMLILLGFIEVLKLISKGDTELVKVASTILAIGVCILLLSVAMKILASLDVKQAFVATTLLATLMTLVVGMLWGIKEVLSGEQIPKMIGIMVSISILLVAMTVCVMVLSILDGPDIAKALLAITVLTALIAGLLEMIVIILSIGGRESVKAVMGVIIALTVAIAVMTTAVMLLASVPEKDLVRAAIALAAIMAVFALMLAAVSLIVKFSGVAVIGTVIAVLIALTVFIAVLTALLIGVAMLTEDPEKLKTTAIALAAFLAAIALVMLAAAALSAYSILALAGVAATLLVFLALWGATAILEQMNIPKVLPIVLALSLLIFMLLEPMAIMALFAILGPLAIVGLVALDAVVAMLFGSIMAFASVIELIDSKFGDGSVIILINKVGDVLHAMGEALGKGVSGFLLGLTSDLEAIGSNISKFMDAISPGLEKVKSFKSDIVDGAKNLLDFFKILTKSKFSNWIGNIFSSTESIATDLGTLGEALGAFVTGIGETDLKKASNAGKIAKELIEDLNAIEGNKGIFSIFSSVDMEQFKTDAGALGSAISTYLTNINGAGSSLTRSSIDTTSFDSGTINTVASGLVGVMNSLQGHKSVSKEIGIFGENAAIFISSITSVMADLSRNANTLTNTNGIDAVRNVTAVMTELESGLPNATNGKIKAWFVGEKDNLENFGSRLQTFANAICDFGYVIAYRGRVLSSATVTNAMNAAKVLGELETNLPSSGSTVKAWFSGEQDNLADFGSRLAAFANGLCDFGYVISWRGKILLKNQNLIDAAINVAKMLAGLEENLPESNGTVKSWFVTNSGDFETFGTDLVALGTAFADFANSLIDTDFSIIEKALPYVRGFVGQLKIISEIETSSRDLSTMASILGVLGTSLNTFCGEVEGIDYSGLDDALSAIKKIVDLANSLYNRKGSEFNNLTEGLRILANEGVNSFAGIFNSADRLAVVTECVSEFISNFVDAITSDDNKSEIEAAADELLLKFIDTISNSGRKEEAKTKGSDFAQGFIYGISGKTGSVYSVAYDLGRRAVRGLSDGIASRSPSKEAIKRGSYFGEGFVIGIDSYSNNVYSSASSLGATALNSLNNAITSAKDMLENNIDSQPTIRPVLDLSDIQSGAGRIGALLNSSPMIFGGSGMAQSISRNFIGQNGRNYDVVSALDRLGSDIVNNSTGDSYVINGISYEEGSDVAEAIQTLAHAATVNGRR